MDQVKKEVMEKWTPEKASEATGTPVEDIEYVARTLAENRPGFIIWAMGQTQHNAANGIVRASNILMLALGNVGRSGGGCNIYRGHDNVQGATDVGPNPDSLPGYYGIAPGSWAHFARVWGVDLDWLKKQFATPAMMEKPGITVSRCSTTFPADGSTSASRQAACRATGRCSTWTAWPARIAR
jgi:formate dehydrogenase major subunit